MIKEEIEFLKESNYIENEYSDKALQDSKQAWNFAKKHRHNKIDLSFIKNIHLELMRRLNSRIAGQIRDCDVWVGGRKCFEPKKIRLLLQDWCAGANCPFNEIIAEEYIKKSHIRFEHIHPFEDGNGRTGRILMNVQRLNAGLPILIIYDKEKLEYYKWFKEKNCPLI